MHSLNQHGFLLSYIHDKMSDPGSKNFKIVPNTLTEDYIYYTT